MGKVKIDLDIVLPDVPPQSSPLNWPPKKYIDLNERLHNNTASPM